MMYLVKLQFDPDDLIQAYCDNQGISIEQCDLSVEEILRGELGWLDASRVVVLELEEAKE
ncbi:MAG: hypothetical protein AAF378_09655 [Cyanobacteria bacterium P01_A01_bin.84]